MGDELRILQELQVRMAVERSQRDIPITKFQQAERGVDDLPVHLERLDRRHAYDQLQQRGDSSTGGEDGDTVAFAGLIENARKPTTYTVKIGRASGRERG